MTKSKDYNKVSQNERFMKEAIAASGVGLWEWSVPDNNVIYSSEWFTMLGYAEDEYPSGFATWEKLTHDDDKEPILEKADRAFLGDINKYEGRFRMLCKDGSWKWIHAKGMVTERDQEGKALKIFGIHIDISKEMSEEIALKEALKKEAEARAVKEQFLATMSHEIRTPMNGIMGMLELALKTPLNEEQKDFLETALKSSQHLLHILNDTLDISRLEQGAMSLDISKFNIIALLNDTVSLFTATAMKKKIELNLAIDESCPQYLDGDEQKLRQILINIIGNAVKFTQDGHIDIHASISNENGKTILNITISDTGIGIPKDKQEHIFEAFKQVDASISRNYGGTGLGLAITKKLISLLQGEITIESALKKGSTFEIKIPLSESTSKLTNQNDEIQCLKEVKFSYSNDGILIVEDNPINQMILKKFLEVDEIPITTVNNGKAAVDLCKRSQFDLILMDIHMPMMDGVTATKEIKKGSGLNSNTPIIAVTADALAGDKEKYLKSGMSDYITKPINRSLLLKTISIYL
ncbi:ATP-binding protein [Temperatibacter marinus]|uniref:histidine kinase n=1 Tax=Temperatibacter marinus TaxID=1456591 RepID=A0AA52EKB6_9PROT|nr:ATP-binding protein [Temperatibacter marinus]WND04069.1 ATP-binding protein [Temperatibacter marinus]